jgi:hypothetical protein
MSATLTKKSTQAGLPAGTFNRILEEGYGPGAWYGSDLRAAVADVTAASAFARPAKGRHSIAEVALHHAYCAMQVESKLTGEAPAPFPLDGEDWFELSDRSTLSWSAVTKTLDAAHQRLSQAVKDIASGARTSPLGEAERFDLVIGITGHAAYHAGQIQLLKKLIANV